MALGGILAVAAAAGTGCPTLQLTPTRAGFGNALQALYKAYDLAGHCGLRLELVESPLDREVVSGEVVSGRGRAGDRYRRICARLSCAGTTFVPAAAPADGQAATRWESKQCPGNPGPGGCAGAPCAVVGLPAFDEQINGLKDLTKKNPQFEKVPFESKNKFAVTSNELAEGD